MDHSDNNDCLVAMATRRQKLRWGKFSLAQWLWYWLFNRAVLVQILSEPYISAMHLFISFFVTSFDRKNLHKSIKFALKRLDFLIRVIFNVPHTMALQISQFVLQFAFRFRLFSFNCFHFRKDLIYFSLFICHNYLQKYQCQSSYCPPNPSLLLLYFKSFALFYPSANLYPLRHFNAF